MSFNSTGAGSGDRIPSGYRQGQVNQFTPQQHQLFQQMFGQVGKDSSTYKLAMGDQDQFAQMEAPALRQFSQLQGSLASRFSGMGVGGRKGSSFQNASGQLSSNFAQDLASRRQDLQRQAIQDLMGMSQSLLGQRPYEKFLTPKREEEGTNWGGLIGGVGGAAAGFVGSGGNPMAAAKLGMAGYQMGSGF